MRFDLRSIKGPFKIISKVLLSSFLKPVQQYAGKPPGGKWKVKLLALEVLDSGKLLQRMKQDCESQLNAELADLVKVLVAGCVEVLFFFKILSPR